MSPSEPQYWLSVCVDLRAASPGVTRQIDGFISFLISWHGTQVDVRVIIKGLGDHLGLVVYRWSLFEDSYTSPWQWREARLRFSFIW